MTAEIRIGIHDEAADHPPPPPPAPQVVQSQPPTAIQTATTVQPVQPPRQVTPVATQPPVPPPKPPAAQQLSHKEWDEFAKRFGEMEREKLVKSGQIAAPTAVQQGTLFQGTQADRVDHEKLLEYRRRKIDVRTQREMQEHGTPEAALNAVQQQRDEDYAVRQERRELERAQRRADQQARQQQRDEDYAVRQERRAETQAQREQARIAIQQQRNEDYAAKQAQRDRQQAERSDPYRQAEKSRESQVRREQIKAAYEEMYGSAKETRSAFDVTLDVAQRMRGTLGGVFGTLIGSLLDVAAAVREAQPKAKSSVRLEAERLNATQREVAGQESRQTFRQTEGGPQVSSPRADQVPVVRAAPVSSPRADQAPVARAAPAADTQEWWPPAATPRKMTPPPPMAIRADQPPMARPAPATDTKEWWPSAATPRKMTPPPPMAIRADQVPVVRPAPAADTKASSTATAATAAVAPPPKPAADDSASTHAESAIGAIPVVGGFVVAGIELTKAVRAAAVTVAKAPIDAMAKMAELKDGSAKLHEFGESLSSASDKAFLPAIALGAALAPVTGGISTLVVALPVLGSVVGGVTSSIAAFDDSVKSTAQRLGQYHGGLASQNAMQEVSELMRDLNRAGRFGQVTMEANAARFNMEQKLADITDRFIPFVMKIGEKLFNLLEGGFETIDDTLKLILRSADGVLEYVRQMIGVLPGFGDVRTAIDEIRRLIRIALENNAANDDVIWNAFLQSGNVQGLENVAPMVPAPQAALQPPPLL